MNKEYQCKKCGTIYEDEQSERFVKTTLRKCPICGSSEVTPLSVFKKKSKSFIKKIGKVK